MGTIGLDLHKRESQLCIGRDDGSVEERRIVTSRERFTAVLGAHPPARVLVEASTASEWVARHRPAYRLSDARRHVRAELAVRDALVRTRTRYIALAKALVRRDGLRAAASEAHLVAKRIAALDISDALSAERCRCSRPSRP